MSRSPWGLRGRFGAPAGHTEASPGVTSGVCGQGASCAPAVATPPRGRAGPFIPVEALDTAFSSKCLCGGKRHDICALHAAPLIAVSTDGVLAGSARQALHAAAVSIGGIRYRLVACLSHKGAPKRP
ncbi:hypothetical protein PAPYR_8897 [Paratrimastix pyriformis]|uniref:Uncharacterized protein n=1 Tax=Paratrimastix pyriformis TaxID=342808 RepID=A0ABQ8UC93_9EUKA|nr:hypothetical protein PAPYR_8897 [Paratrimastix pyriformis]